METGGGFRERSTQKHFVGTFVTRRHLRELFSRKSHQMNCHALASFISLRKLPVFICSLWTQTLLAEGNDLPKYGFGGKNRLSLRGNLAAVGAPGAEAVFLYRRSATSVTGGGGGGEEGGSEGAVRWAWERWPVKTFVSSDLDYDVSLQKKTVHRQVWEASVRWGKNRPRCCCRHTKNSVIQSFQHS